MSKLTTADVRYRIVFIDGETLTVQVIVADRAAADAQDHIASGDPGFAGGA